ncbi:hypothetical protein, partial [Stenotrophomonas indicatrix]|uniref:hypothetical protein n=1 Tax=Stenotrophomonas indicatrix TaxID=2045451 RepID=UPI001966EC76
ERLGAVDGQTLVVGNGFHGRLPSDLDRWIAASWARHARGNSRAAQIQFQRRTENATLPHQAVGMPWRS